MDMEAIAQVDTVGLDMNLRNSCLLCCLRRSRQSGTESGWIGAGNRHLLRDRGREKGTCYILRETGEAQEMRVFIPEKAERGVVRRLVMRRGRRRSKV